MFRGLSGRCVLTQEWVEGRKLTDITSDPSTGPLRAKLVQTLLNSYMVQFLETGFLHADPHPELPAHAGRPAVYSGLRHDDGDFTRSARGVHRVHRAPLRARLRENLTDLVNLGFVPPELANDPRNRDVVVPVLAETLETLYGSGGARAKKLDKLSEQGNSRVSELSDKLEQLSKEYPLQLPPYFVLILRAFGTLEGLGLSVDENYAIVDECFLFVTSRACWRTTRRACASAALRSFVYGGGDRLKISRVRSVAAGFGRLHQQHGRSRDRGGERRRQKRLFEGVPSAEHRGRGDEGRAERCLRRGQLPAGDSGGGVRARGGCAQARRRQRRVARAGLPGNGAGRASSPPVALVPGVNLPLVLSLLASRNGGAVALTRDDKRNLALLRSVAERVAPDAAFRWLSGTNAVGPRSSPIGRFRDDGTGNDAAEDVRRVAALVAELGPTVAPGVRRMSGAFAEQFSARIAERTREDLANACPSRRGRGARGV